MAKNPITGLEESPATLTGDGTTKPVVPNQTAMAPAPSVISPSATVPMSASSNMTGAITDKGAYNPTTGGYETIAPTVGVNTQQFSPEAKQSAWEKAGNTGEYDPNAFGRSTEGTLELKGAAPVVPEVLKLETKPAAEVVMPGAEKTPAITGAPTDQTSQVDTIVDQMFPKDKYSEEERAAIKQGLASKDPKAWADLMATGTKGAFDDAQNILNAYRTDRDLKASMTRENQLNDRRVQDLTQQYDTAIKDQKARMEADQNNMAVVQGQAGRLASRNMTNAVNQLLDKNLSVYNQLVGNKDRDLQRLAEDIKYAQTTLSNEYNDKISENMAEMLKNVQALDSTGQLNTQQGLVQARSFVQKTLENNVQHQADYYNKLQYISARYDQYNKEYQDTKKVDEGVTAQMGDGYLYNVSGARVTNDQNQPIKVNSTAGTFVSMADDGLGGKVAIFRGLDGKIRTEQAVTAPQLTPQQVTSAKNLIAAGAKPEDVAKMLGMNGQQMAEALQGVTDIPGYAADNKAQVIYKEVTDADGNVQKIPGYFDPSTKQFVYSDGSSASQAPTSSSQISSAQSIAKYSVDQRNGRTNLQCGELVNDYWKMVTGKSMGIGNSIGSKANAIRQIGSSEVPVPGGIFVSDPLQNGIGHTGIIQSVNPDGSITVLEANAQGKKEGQPPVLKTYTADKIGNMMFSQAPAGGAAAVGGTTPSTADASQYGLKNDTEMQWAKDFADGAATLQQVNTYFGKNKNAISRVMAAKDQITADTNSQALIDNGIDVAKIAPSMKQSILSMNPAALSALSDVVNYKAGIDMATARSTTGLNRVAFEAAAGALAKAKGDNNWSADQYKRIASNFEEYSKPTGSLGTKRTALNTAINHIGEEVQTYKELGNTNYPWLNNMLNKVREATGAGEPLAQKIVSQALGSETAKAYAGAQSSQSEREAWAQDMQAGMSPAQQDAFAQLTIKLLAGAARSVKAEGLKSVSVGGKPMRQLENVLDDNTRQIVQSIGLDPNSFENASTTSTTSIPETKGIDQKASQSILNILRNTK